MPDWLTYLIAFGLLCAAAPLIAGFARGAGRRARGGLMMASILLGFGEAIDPPSKHIIEAQGGEEKPAENDEPVQP